MIRSSRSFLAGTSMRRFCAVVLLLPLTVSAWYIGCGPRGSTVSRQVALLDRLDTARIEWSDEEPSLADLTLIPSPDGPLARLRLRADSAWREAGQGGPGARLGGTGLKAWKVPLTLPTSYATGVRVELAGDMLATWQPSSPPAAPAGFYSAGGFLGRNLHLALSEEDDPRMLELAVVFPPDRGLLLDLVGVAQEGLLAQELSGWATAGREHRNALLVPNRAAVEFPTRIRRTTRLVFWVARKVHPWVVTPPVTTLLVEVNSGTGWRVAGEVEFGEPAELEPSWERVSVDLGAMTGSEARLRFRVPSTDGVGQVAHYVADPALVAPGAGRSRPNFLMIFVDGLRADLEPWEGGADGLAPNLAALSNRGLTFTQARAPAPWTRASMASILTGLTPVAHGVDSERDSARLPDGVPTLAGVLRAHRYATATVGANPHLDPAFGLPSGFSSVVAWMPEGGEALTEALDVWIADRPHDPFFLLAFYMDTHAPWKRRPEFAESDLDDDAPVRDVRRLGKAVGRAQRGEAEPTAEEVATLYALYLENVRYVDHQIGRVLDALEHSGLASETIVVVTADHGEAFGEHGDFFHGWNLYDELVHVPLIVAGPRIPGGKRIDTPISLTSLPALLLEWLGIEDAPMADPALARRILRGEAPVAPQLLSTRFRGAGADALVRWPWKLILTFGGVELYDLKADPREHHDLANRDDGVARRMLRDLQRLMAQEEARRPVSDGPEVDREPDAETLERLRALGYLE